MRGMKEPRLSGNFEVFYLRFAVKEKTQVDGVKEVGGKKGDQCVDDAAIFNANRQTGSDRFCLLCRRWRRLSLRLAAAAAPAPHEKKAKSQKSQIQGPAQAGRQREGDFQGRRLLGARSLEKPGQETRIAHFQRQASSLPIWESSEGPGEGRPREITTAR
jgi:hypothetical protein